MGFFLRSEFSHSLESQSGSVSSIQLKPGVVDLETWKFGGWKERRDKVTKQERSDRRSSRREMSWNPRKEPFTKKVPVLPGAAEVWCQRWAQRGGTWRAVSSPVTLARTLGEQSGGIEWGRGSKWGWVSECRHRACPKEFALEWGWGYTARQVEAVDQEKVLFMQTYLKKVCVHD